MKLLLLVGAVAVIGFFAVLVVDVSATLLGRVHVGPSTASAVWHKVVDRVLDRDVPRTQPSSSSSSSAPTQRPSFGPAHAGAAPFERPPLPATRPEDDARHTGPRRDPQLERAKQRLDDLLGRL